MKTMQLLLAVAAGMIIAGAGQAIWQSQNKEKPKAPAPVPTVVAAAATPTPAPSPTPPIAKATSLPKTLWKEAELRMVRGQITDLKDDRLFVRMDRKSKCADIENIQLGADAGAAAGPQLVQIAREQEARKYGDAWMVVGGKLKRVDFELSKIFVGDVLVTKVPASQFNIGDDVKLIVAPVSRDEATMTFDFIPEEITEK